MVADSAPWEMVLSAWAKAQFESASNAVETMEDAIGSDSGVRPRPFAGVTSLGLDLHEPLVATIDARVAAPVEALPPPWWDDPSVFLAQVAQLIHSEIQDAGVLVLPSCKRCVPLASRVYRDLEGFDRHPGCDCEHWPVGSREQAEELGLITDPQEAFERGEITGLTEAERRAIEDGSSISSVVNSSSGITTADLYGRRVKATTYGTTKRAAWRKRNPTRPVRLRPESIYKIVDQDYGGDRRQAIRLLRLYGYLD